MSMFAAYFADIRLLDLEILAASNAIDVLCVSETWLSDTRAKPGSPCVNLPGFQTPFRCGRIGNCWGGGVAIYVHTGLHATRISLSGSLEAVCVRLNLARRRCADVVAVYRPPKLDMFQFVSSLDSDLLKV